jgi:anti-anti-sigma factor
MITNISGSKVPFKLTENERLDAKCSFIAKGAINANSSKELEHKLEQCLQNGQTHIYVDMNAVTFLSSSGVKVLLDIYKKATERGGILKITNPAENVENVIGMTALDELLL